MRAVLAITGLLTVAALAGYLFRNEDMPALPAQIEDPARLAGAATNSTPGCEAPCRENEASSTGASRAEADLPCPYCNQDGDLWRQLTTTPPPELLGNAAVLMDGDCGKVLYGLHARERRPAASLVKIVTAMSVIENSDLEDTVNVTVNGWDLVMENNSSIMGLTAGQRLSVEELLYGLLLTSGNDAALALSGHMGGEARLVALMNERVAGLGLTDTQLRNTHGLDDPNAYSTPFDMVVLGRELLRDPVLKAMVATEYVEAPWHDIGGLWNGNYLMYIYEDAIGIKTGYTEQAGWSIVSAAERNGRVLIASVFDSADVYWDSMRLFDWAFDNMSSTC